MYVLLYVSSAFNTSGSLLGASKMDETEGINYECRIEYLCVPEVNGHIRCRHGASRLWDLGINWISLM